MVEVGICCLSRYLERDADTQEGFEGLLLANATRSVWDKVTILDERAHHRARDALPVWFGLHRVGRRERQ